MCCSVVLQCCVADTTIWVYIYVCIWVYILWVYYGAQHMGLRRPIVGCSVLQCVAVCCSVLQRVAVCCSVLQCVAECCRVLQCVAVCCTVPQRAALWCSVFQCVPGFLKNLSWLMTHGAHERLSRPVLGLGCCHQDFVSNLKKERKKEGLTTLFRQTWGVGADTLKNVGRRPQKGDILL